jgi:hypothetical protein
MLPHFSRLDLVLYAALFAAMVLACLVPKLGDPVLLWAERLGARLAARKGLAILAIVLAVPLVRFSLVRLLPAPVPAVHDEFSYLLAADTFAHGRLTNPPHPMSIYFETIHVNQRPTYMSKYPPAQGAILAAGQLLGHPWIGVVLSSALMCGAVLWMLQGWMPARWALLGAALVLLRLALFSYWVNSYWGGTVAAIGGALVTGALPRILRWQRTRDALLLGLGAAILANSRPFEGVLLCAPVGVSLAAWLLSRRSPPWRATLRSVCLPLAAVLLVTGIFAGYYNWRGTESPFLFPYVLNERTYLSTPPFAWQHLTPPAHFSSPQLEFFYNQWARSYWQRMRFAVHWRAGKFFYFFLWPELCVPFLALPWLLRDRRIRFLLVQFVICFAGMMTVVWFEPHYAAPLVATLYALVVQAIRHLRHGRLSNRACGFGITRAIVSFSAAMSLVYVASAIHNPHTESLVAPAGAWATPGNYARAEAEAQLEALPGQHLAIVRYSSESRGGEWVYNRADIDHAKVVWAREIPGVEVRPLLEYFKGSQVWLVEPTGSAARITVYPASPPR